MCITRTEGYTLEQGLNSVGRGWSGLVHEAFQALPDCCKIVQVKEKFGALRIYAHQIDYNDNVTSVAWARNVDRTTAYQKTLNMLEYRSMKYCEQCGERGDRMEYKGAYFTACNAHAEQHIKYLDGLAMHNG